MAAENEEIEGFDNVAASRAVNGCEDLRFDSSLFVHLICVDDDFDGDVLFCFVISTTNDLAESACTEKFENFEAVGEVVTDDEVGVVGVVVESVVVNGIVIGNDFVVRAPEVVNLGEVYNLFTFVLVEK